MTKTNLCLILLFLGLVGCQSPAEKRALADIEAGRPRYYEATGIAGPRPRHRALQSLLATRRIEWVGTGCIRSSADDEYNAVIVDHFRLEKTIARFEKHWRKLEARGTSDDSRLLP